jgi:hypothetical protein
MVKGPAMKERDMSDLESANPVAADGDDKLHELVGQMARAARLQAGEERSVEAATWWKRPRALLPISVVSIVALTGGAILIPLTLSVSGVEVEPDVEIPIVYTTDTGVDVSCREQIFFGEPSGRDEADVRIAEFMRTHDWTGIGQRIYEDALATPIIPERDGGTEPGFDQASFSAATSRLIEAEIPASLRGAGEEEGTVYSSATDCTGELHR